MNSKDLRWKMEEFIHNTYNHLDQDDYRVVADMVVDGRKYELMIGYDVFTENEDGTICNSDEDIQHYYVEIWNNFSDDIRFEIGDGAPLYCDWYDKDWTTEEKMDYFEEAIKAWAKAPSLAED